MLALLAAAAGGGTRGAWGDSAALPPWGGDPPAAQARARTAAIVALGRRIFFDRTLSASGALSCADCHDPAHGFGPAGAVPVRMGGPALDRPGTRAVPGLTYGQFAGTFTEHYHMSDDEGDESADQGPTGGRTWDGRVNRAREQAAIPLLADNEMANKDEAAVAARAAAASWAGELRRLFGAAVFADPHRAFAAIAEALEYYQDHPPDFSPFSSKYDAYLRHRARLTDQEARGLAAFEDPAKGNCARCHRSRPSLNGAPPLFTDAGYTAIGLPRNMAIPANADPAWFDLGLCGPQRKDLADRPWLCGMFKAPSLRNAALRQSFYHNGVFRTLEDAIAFYATRDTNPERWFPVAPDGSVQIFNDLPERYRANIDTEPPFGGHPGGVPALSPADVADIAAFLRTLTDGYRPAAPE